MKKAATKKAKGGRKPYQRVGPGLELLSRKMGNAPSMDFVKPLIDTGDLLKSITYVIRPKSAREK